MNPRCDKCDKTFEVWEKYGAGHIVIWEANLCKECWHIEQQYVNAMKPTQTKYSSACTTFKQRTDNMQRFGSANHCDTCGFHRSHHENAGPDQEED